MAKALQSKRYAADDGRFIWLLPDTIQIISVKLAATIIDGEHGVVDAI
jgi:hypothetical protein